jgi:MFS family permease
MAAYWQSIRSFSPSLQRFLISIAMESTVFFGILAVLQNLFLLRLGFDAKFIGLVLGLGQLVLAIAALPAGLVSSRLGLRNGILLGQAVFACALGLMLLVEGQPKPLWPLWLIGCQAFLMAGVSLIAVSISPYLMVVTGEEERRHAFAIFQALLPATVFAGSLLAGWLPALFASIFGMALDQAAPYRLALWVGPLLLLLSMLPLWTADPGKTATQDAGQATVEPPPVRLLFFFGVVTYLVAVGEGTVRAFFNIYLDAGLAVPSTQIGTIMGVTQLLPIAAALAAPILMARWGTGYALAGAILGVAASLLLLAVVPTLWMAVLAYMAVVATVTVTATTRAILSQELVTPKWRTTMAGVAIIGLALGWSTAGLVGGLLVDTLGFGALFFAGAAVELLAFVVLSAYLRTRRLPTPIQATEHALT